MIPESNYTSKGRIIPAECFDGDGMSTGDPRISDERLSGRVRTEMRKVQTPGTVDGLPGMLITTAHGQLTIADIFYSSFCTELNKTAETDPTTGLPKMSTPAAEFTRSKTYVKQGLSRAFTDISRRGSGEIKA